MAPRIKNKFGCCRDVWAWPTPEPCERFSCSQTATAGRRCCCSAGPEGRGRTATRPGWSTQEATAGATRTTSVRLGAGPPTLQFTQRLLRDARLTDVILVLSQRLFIKVVLFIAVTTTFITTPLSSTFLFFTHIRSSVESVSTHVKRSFRNIRRAPESKGAVALETGILVATLHHLVATPHLRVAMETLQLLLVLLERSTMGS